MLITYQNVTPLLQVAEHREAGRFTSIEQEYPQILNRARAILVRETAHVKLQPWQDDKWSRVLPHLPQNLFQVRLPSFCDDGSAGCVRESNCMNNINIPLTPYSDF